MAQEQIVQVAVDVPLFGSFSYLTHLTLSPGQRVGVRFGSRVVCGVVVDEIPTGGIAREKMRHIDYGYDGLPALPADFMQMVKFVSGYYHHPLGQTIFTALPTGLRDTRNILLPDHRHFGLTEQGHGLVFGPRQRAKQALWLALSEAPLSRQDAKAVTAQANKLLSEWEEHGWVTRVNPPRPELVIEHSPLLNDEQQRAVNQLTLLDQPGKPWLLHGITGSGKTEVYLRVIEQQLRANRQTLVLIPEINLTPQLISRFSQRFPASRIVVMHSNLADGERLAAWLACWQGEADIVIGTRLSVFVPLPKLGLIIVDEEHDGSFKQQDGLRYHARDMAVWRAQQAGVSVVLGSATPSLETLSNAKSGRYGYLCLGRRAHESAVLPQVRLVDIRRQKLQEGLAEPVIDAIRSRLSRHEMSLIYINRRGFAPVVACNDCGWMSGCPHCSAKLVVHLSDRLLRCHHCGWYEAVPTACPDCGNPDIKPLGQGTQRLEAALARFFPDARILRIDRDTTSRKEAWDQVYAKVHSGEVDILLGTQMLAKGHDFGGLSLVVVVNADGGLYSADFRASERLFAQLTQVAGRAGRAAVAGEVYVQTQWPEHSLYQSLVKHDYEGYMDVLLEERQQAMFPPSVYQAMLRADALTEEVALVFLQQVRDVLLLQADRVMVSGPAPALMAKLANRVRAQLIFESDSRKALHGFLREALPSIEQLARKNGKALRWSIDVDPQEM